MATLAPHVFRLPDLGEGLTEAELVSWLVAVGDEIRVDQAIAEVETAKSVVELPSPHAGTVLALHGRAGDVIQVGAPVLEVGSAADLPSPAGKSAEEPSPEPAIELEAHRTEEQAGSGNVLIGYGTSGHTGATRRRPRRPEAGSVATHTQADPPALTPAPILKPTSLPARKPVRSPVVRRLARDLGLDLNTIAASGPDGAITRDDVLRTASGNTSTPVASGVANPPRLTIVSRERMSMLRRAVSAKMSLSRSEIPDATVWVDVDVTNLWEMRPSMAVGGSRPPSLTAILARYVLLALQEYPLLAGRIDGEEIIQFDGVNLGAAVNTDRGLLVPVIDRAHDLSIAELDESLRELATEARSGSLGPEHLAGSTFTLNNYGSLGVDGSAAIINHPEVAILGIGRVLERPWAVAGELAVRRVAQLSLVFDHRVCDGGYAAGFLRRVVDLIEAPLTAYVRI